MKQSQSHQYKLQTLSLWEEGSKQAVCTCGAAELEGFAGLGCFCPQNFQSVSLSTTQYLQITIYDVFYLLVCVFVFLFVSWLSGDADNYGPFLLGRFPESRLVI